MRARDRQPSHHDDERLLRELPSVFKELEVKNRKEVARKCGVAYVESGSGRGRIIVSFLNRTYSVELGSKNVVDIVSGKVAGCKIAYLIVKYLSTGDGASLDKTWQSFDMIPGAGSYLGEFRKRVLTPLAITFGKEPRAFEKACTALGGRRENVGGISFSFSLLPKVKTLCQLWKLVEEEYIPPAANICFNKSVHHYLSPKELLLAGQVMVELLQQEAFKRR